MTHIMSMIQKHFNASHRKKRGAVKNGAGNIWGPRLCARKEELSYDRRNAGMVAAGKRRDFF
jgi:hypothetical protein